MSFFNRIAQWWRIFKERYRECKSHGPGKVLLNKYFLASMVFLVIVGIVDTNNVGEYIRTGRQLRDQEKQIKAYQEAIKATESKLNSLQSQKDSLENFAREEYYYSEDGEDIYLVED